MDTPSQNLNVDALNKQASTEADDHFGDMLNSENDLQNNSRTNSYTGPSKEIKNAAIIPRADSFEASAPPINKLEPPKKFSLNSMFSNDI